MTLTWPITHPAPSVPAPDLPRHYGVSKVPFTANCPRCGNPCQWTGIREDCRARSEVECGCGGAVVSRPGEALDGAA